MKTPAYVTIPAGTCISVRTIDAIDSTQKQVGDRFQASLEEPLRVDGNEIVSRDAAVYGRLAESKESGTFTGRSPLRPSAGKLVGAQLHADEGIDSPAGRGQVHSTN